MSFEVVDDFCAYVSICWCKFCLTDIITTKEQNSLSGISLWNWWRLWRWVIRLTGCPCPNICVICSYPHNVHSLVVTVVKYFLWPFMDVDDCSHLNFLRIVLCEFFFYLHVLPLVCRCHGKCGEILRLLYMLTLKTGFQFHKAGSNCYLHLIYQVVGCLNYCHEFLECIHDA